MTDEYPVQGSRTEVDAWQYVASLALLGKVVSLGEAEGAEAFQVSDEHLLIMTCACGQDHQGHEILARLLVPPSWECFHAVYNDSDDQDWEGYHYGPVWDDEVEP